LEQLTQIPTHILNHLVNDDEYCRRVIPYLSKDYFQGEHKAVFDLIIQFVAKHNKLPTTQVLDIELTKYNMPDDLRQQASALISIIGTKTDLDSEYLLQESEKWCKERALHNALMESYDIAQGNHNELSEGAIPDILSTALGVSFDHDIGHDYIENAEDRFEFYQKEEEKIPFDLSYLNKITKGGVSRKTLNIILASTGVGKSLFMCHQAAANISAGQNVLYITLEMSEEKIAERIDANLFHMPISDIDSMDKDKFDSKIEKIARKGFGKLIIKEYPTASAHVGHFRGLLNELKLKKRFMPDVIYIDYLNIASSSRVKNVADTYSYVKSIAEELRGLAIEFDVPIFSATQSNRDGYQNSDIDLANTSESFGLPATADLMFALISNEELEELGQIMVKQLKNRYNDVGLHKRFVIGVDKTQMRLFDVEESAQDGLMKDKSEDIDIGPINSFGENENKNDFGEFKV
tara:strand:- start:4764 stop:6155 length:1392 start_codon:yes stop_codon:yes gene_type:complete